VAKAPQLIRALKRELEPVESEIRRHPYLDEVEAGHLTQEDLRIFAGEQYHIIRSDLRSVALLVNRFASARSGPFFQGILAGEAAASAALRDFADAVGLDEARLQAYEPHPGCQAYPAWMAWLALYGADAEVAAGFLVNFAAWGANCGRMNRALRARYRMGKAETAFFDLFASPPAEFERGALTVVEAGLARGAEPRLIKRAARLLQGYEKLYWDTLFAELRRRR
jgi:thiaminase